MSAIESLMRLGIAFWITILASIMLLMRKREE